MFLLVPAHSGCPGQNPESCKLVVCVCVCVYFILTSETHLVVLAFVSFIDTVIRICFVLCVMHLNKLPNSVVF